MTLAGIYTRVLLAWLIAMQPLLGAYAATQAVPAPLAAELCRGAPAPSGDVPSTAPHHRDCCLAACANAAVPPAQTAAIDPPRSPGPSPLSASLTGTSLAPAGRGREPARAPPV